MTGANIATVGLLGRAPELEERLVLGVIRSLDTNEYIVQIPCGVKLNGVNYLVKWSDNPPENAPAGALDSYYKSGRCANCGRYWGDHPYGSKEWQPMKESLV